MLEGEGPRVLLEYLTEPPHRDPQYAISIDGVSIGGWKTPIPFFGRDLHVSPCSRFLATTSLRIESFFHVIDRVERTYFSRRGFVKIEAVSARSIHYRPYVSVGSKATPGTAEVLSLASARWFDIATPLDEAG